MMIVTTTIWPIMIPALASDPKMFCETVEFGDSLYTVYCDCVGLHKQVQAIRGKCKYTVTSGGGTHIVDCLISIVESLDDYL